MRVLALILLLSTPALADNVTTLHVTGTTCHTCWGPQSLSEHSLDITMTVISGTGRYWHPIYRSFEMRGDEVQEVVALEGSLDGTPIALMLGTQGDGRSWLWNDGGLGLVWYTGGRLIGDTNGMDLLQFGSGQVPLSLQWETVQPQLAAFSEAVEVPEGSSAGMLMVGLLGILGYAFATRNAARGTGAGR